MSTKIVTPSNGTATKNAEVKNLSATAAPIEKTIVSTIEQIKKQTERRSQIIDTLGHMQESKSKLQKIILACNGNGESITIEANGEKFSIKHPILVKQFGFDIDKHICDTIEKLEIDLQEA
jgi:hypothetical protein